MKVKKMIAGILKMGSVIGAIGGVFYLKNNEVKKQKKLFEQQSAYYALAQQWIANYNSNKSMSVYFKEHNINSIAIYGMGTLGELFYDEIKNSGVEISYFIDKNANEIYSGLDDIDIVGIKDIKAKELVDLIVITPVYSFDEIVEDLESNGVEIEMISLEDIIYEI